MRPSYDCSMSMWNFGMLPYLHDYLIEILFIKYLFPSSFGRRKFYFGDASPVRNCVCVNSVDENNSYVWITFVKISVCEYKFKKKNVNCDFVFVCSPFLLFTLKFNTKTKKIIMEWTQIINSTNTPKRIKHTENQPTNSRQPQIVLKHTNKQTKFSYPFLSNSNDIKKKIMKPLLRKKQKRRPPNYCNNSGNRLMMIVWINTYGGMDKRTWRCEMGVEVF